MSRRELKALAQECIAVARGTGDIRMLAHARELLRLARFARAAR